MSGLRITLALLPIVMIFAVALELRLADFRRIVRMPTTVLIGLVPQFILLPIATLLVTLLTDLPAAIEAAMLLVACCPGGAMSNVITHISRGNTALSLSLSATATPLSIVLTPFNFGWTVAANPATRDWLREIAVSPLEVAAGLLILLAIPMALGLGLAYRRPTLAARLAPGLLRLTTALLAILIIAVVVDERALLSGALLVPFLIVVLHNGLGLVLGAGCARLCRLDAADSRAVTFEAGMQNSTVALSLIAVYFNNDLSMFVIASLWGIWHLLSGFGLALYLRSRDA